MDELEAAAKEDAKPACVECIECDKLRAENRDLREANERILGVAQSAWRWRPPCECERLRELNKKLFHACQLANGRLAYLERDVVPAPGTRRVIREAIAEAEQESQADDAR